MIMMTTTTMMMMMTTMASTAKTFPALRASQNSASGARCQPLLPSIVKQALKVFSMHSYRSHASGCTTDDLSMSRRKGLA